MPGVIAVVGLPVTVLVKVTGELDVLEDEEVIVLTELLGLLLLVDCDEAREMNAATKSER